MIDAIMNRLGFVRTERARAWAIEAFDQAQTRRDAYYCTAFCELIATANDATRQRGTLQEALDRANRRLEYGGLMPIVTFI